MAGTVTIPVRKLIHRPGCELGEIQYMMEPSSRHVGYVVFQVLVGREVAEEFTATFRCDGSKFAHQAEEEARAKLEAWAKESGAKLEFQ